MRIGRWHMTLVIAALAAGCGTTDPDPGAPPALPLEETMLFDTETFPAATPSQIAAAPQRAPGGTHHTAAAIGVLAINVSVLTITAVPRLTWAALVSRQPTFEDGQWHWRGSTNILGVPYSGDLAAYTEQGEVVAEVRISSPVVSDFLWYDGRAPIGGTTGRWRIYDPAQPTTPVVLSTIDWAHPTADVWTLTFTAVGGANPGDDLAYMVDDDLRSITWYDASEDMTYGITWNAVTREGSVLAAGYNGGLRGCWDGDLQNVACP